MLGFIASHIWKLAASGSGLIMAVLLGLLITKSIENKHLSEQRTALAVQINDPVNGYIVQLAQSRTNVETLKKQIIIQSTAYQALSDESQARLKTLQGQLAVAQSQTRTMEVKLNRFLATKPQGDTLEERVRDIDNRAMTDLVQ